MGSIEDINLDELNTVNNVAEASNDGLVDIVETNNNDVLSDQSDIDKLIASLSGNINPSEFEGMSNDASDDLFEEVGFEENQELSDVIDEAEDDLLDSILDEAENIANNTDEVVEDNSFEMMPSFSDVNMIDDVNTESVMFEESYQNDEFATEIAANNDDFVNYQPVETVEDPNQCNVITKGTIINGGMISDCSLNVMGTINGDIECNGKLSIFGTVVGNSSALDVYVNTRKLVGNIESNRSVKIALGTIVVGDIKAMSAVIAGAVKGNLEINGPVILDSTAIIKGNITAKSIQMNNGAIHEGNSSFAYADIDIDQIFEN